MLQQGYDPGTIRTALLNAGYSPYDVDTALRVAGGVPGRKVSTRTLVITFVALLVVSGVILLVLKFIQPPPVVLSFSLNLFSTQVAPGQEVVVNANIQNPSGRSAKGLIDFVIVGAEGEVASKTESFSVVRSTSVPSTLSMPASAFPGTYSLKATISYDGKSSTQSVSFEVTERAVRQVLPSEVLEKKPEEAARELQLTCPGGCDDLNFCTSDSCVQGVCTYSPITPCCGNYRCESGETPNSCVLDCSERPVGPDEIRQRAKELAVSDLSKALDVCETLGQRELVDRCLSDASEASGSKEPCADIVSSDLRDGCYIPFVYKGDYSVCDEISNQYMKNSCLSLSGVSQFSG
jgi:hypothetical protein